MALRTSMRFSGARPFCLAKSRRDAFFVGALVAGVDVLGDMKIGGHDEVEPCEIVMAHRRREGMLTFVPDGRGALTAAAFWMHHWLLVFSSQLNKRARQGQAIPSGLGAMRTMRLPRLPPVIMSSQPAIAFSSPSITSSR